MKHICVMGEGSKAHFVAHNAAQGDDVFVSRFSVNMHEVVQLMPLYAVTRGHLFKNSSFTFGPNCDKIDVEQ